MEMGMLLPSSGTPPVPRALAFRALTLPSQLIVDNCHTSVLCSADNRRYLAVQTYADGQLTCIINKPCILLGNSQWTISWKL